MFTAFMNELQFGQPSGHKLKDTDHASYTQEMIDQVKYTGDPKQVILQRQYGIQWDLLLLQGARVAGGEKTIK